MKCKYSVTFEFTTNPPITERGTVIATRLRTIIARATDDSVAKNPNCNWSSLSVLIEREDYDNVAPTLSETPIKRDDLD